jgi:hypothetical protein
LEGFDQFDNKGAGNDGLAHLLEILSDFFFGVVCYEVFFQLPQVNGVGVLGMERNQFL